MQECTLKPEKSAKPRRQSSSKTCCEFGDFTEHTVWGRAYLWAFIIVKGVDLAAHPTSVVSLQLDIPLPVHHVHCLNHHPLKCLKPLGLLKPAAGRAGEWLQLLLDA